MRSHRELVESFCTFLVFNDVGNFSGWQEEPGLRRSIESRLRHPPAALAGTNALPEDWARYLHREWKSQPNSRVRDLLWAYLEEARYGAAIRVRRQFNLPQHTLAEYCQMAIAKPDRIAKILAGFNPQRNFSLKGYAYRAFVNAIKENLGASGISSDWALLRRTSPTLLEESLKEAGYSSQQDIGRYKLAQECFKEVYVPTQPKGNRQTLTPTPTDWEEIAQIYNRQRLSQLGSPGAQCNAQTIQYWLQTCARAIRAYVNPPIASLNAHPGQNEEGEIQDSVPSNDGETSVEIIIIEEGRNWVNQILNDAIANLSPEEQQMLRLHYGENLNQTQIAEKLGKSQSTVCRRLDSIRRKLVKIFLKGAPENLHNSPTPEVVTYMSELLEQWLQEYYQPSTLTEISVL